LIPGSYQSYQNWTVSNQLTGWKGGRVCRGWLWICWCVGVHFTLYTPLSISVHKPATPLTREVQIRHMYFRISYIFTEKASLVTAGKLI
jgi:hypothetical protein